MSGPVLGSLYTFSHLIFIIILYGRHYFSHFIDDKTEAQRGSESFLRPQSKCSSHYSIVGPILKLLLHLLFYPASLEHLFPTHSS